MESNRVLHIAEIPHENGQVRFRYERYLSPDRKKWIRHGLFKAYHVNGQLASEGVYEHGVEVGIWRDFHDNGQLAAEGEYKQGKRSGVWNFYSRTGELEGEEMMDDTE